MWEDLADIRTVAADASLRGHGIGHLIDDELLDKARAVGVARVFCLTLAVSFFASHGFTEICGTPVADVSKYAANFSDRLPEIFGTPIAPEVCKYAEIV